jgi:acetyl esterase/lipase
VSVTRHVTGSVALLVLALVTGCGGAGPARTADAPKADLTAEYLPGRAATAYVPSRPDGTVVVLVPGGGWQTADPSGLLPLAARLARRGSLAVAVSYRAADDGARFPAPAEDVACAVSWAAALGERKLPEVRHVVLLGHSAGAHLGSLVALGAVGDAGASGCRSAGVAPDAFVGLAGVYDVGQLADAVAPLFGTTPDEDAARWRAGDPVQQAAGAPDDLRVLLLHGTADTTVPIMQSQRFRDALTAAGVPVDLTPVDGADHMTLFTAPVAAGPVADWLDTLP